jgi:uncharacterized protein YdbL (DUF1318 family)
MLRNFAAALLATSLIAGPAFAMESGNASSAATVRTDASPTIKAAAPSAQPAKHVYKHARSHTRKHVAHRNTHRIKTVHHFKGRKTHKAYVAPKTIAPSTGAKNAKAARVQPVQVPATRTN